MAITLVQSATPFSSSNTNPMTATFTNPTSSGNFLMAIVRQQVNTVSALTDNKSNTWTLKTSFVNYNSNWSLYVYYCANANGGSSHTVSATESSTGWNGDIQIMEFSGVDAAAPFDVNPTGPAAITSNATSTNPTNGQTITTTKPNDYVVGIFDAKTSTTYSAAPGWAKIGGADNGNSVGYVGAIAAAAGSVTPQILSQITGWQQAAFSFALTAAISAGSAVYMYRNPNTGPMAMRNFNRARPLTQAPSQFKANSQAFTAGVSFTGAFTARNVFTKLLTGAISFTGSFAKIPRKLFTAVLTMTGGQTGFQTPTLVQVGTINTTADALSNTLTFGSNITPGNAVIVTVAETGNGTIAGVSDATGAYTQMGSALGYQGVSKQASFYGLNRGGGFNTISVAVSGFTGSGLYVVAEEWSGIGSYEGQVGTTQTGNANLSSGNYTTTGAPDLLVGMFATASTISSPGAGFTNLNGAGGFSYMESQNVLSTGTYAATATMSGATNSASQLAAFRAGSVTIPALKLFTTKVMTATQGFTGSFIRATSKGMSAALSFIGTWASGGHFAYIISLVGANLSFTGSQIKRTSTTKTAGLSFAGNISRFIKRPFTAVLSFVGAFASARGYFRSFTAAVGFTGAFSKRIGKPFTAGLGFVGAIRNAITKSLTAGLSFTGVFSRGGLFFRVLSGGLSFTGNHTKQARKAFTGGVSFAGAFKFGSQFFRTFTAGLSFIGATPPRAIKKGITAGVSFTGAFTRGGIFFRSFTAGLSFTGGFTKRAIKRFTAAVSFVGAFKFGSQFFRSFPASVGFTGTFTKQTTKSLTAGLSFIGRLLKSTFEMFFTASLGFTGAMTKFTKTSFLANLSFTALWSQYIVPIFTPIRVIVSSLTNQADESSSTNIADVSTSGTISSVNSSTSEGTINTGDNSSTVSSSTNNETLEG